MSQSRNSEIAIREELQLQLLRRSRRFSSLYFWSLLANTAVGTIACLCVLTRNSSASVIPAVAGFGATAVVAMSGKESNRALVMLIDFLEGEGSGPIRQ